MTPEVVAVWDVSREVVYDREKVREQLAESLDIPVEYVNIERTILWGNKTRDEITVDIKSIPIDEIADEMRRIKMDARVEFGRQFHDT